LIILGTWTKKQGIERQPEALAQLGLLRRFVGMLNDFRSFLSHTRHEYFRRILCNRLGSAADRGLIPRDMDLLREMVREIGVTNAHSFFGQPVGYDSVPV
jgi:glucuronate isomerase